MGVILVMAFAFALPYYAGALGFAVFDQSILIDGAWRIYSGQIPYKDFSMPHTPLLFYLQALFFSLFGATLFSAVTHAAIFNLIATGITYAGVRRYLPISRGWALGASLITAVWFYAPMSWPWFETLGYLFLLMALLLILEEKPWAFFFSGFFGAVTILCKANVAMVSVATLVGATVLLVTKQNRWRAILYGLAGYLVLLGLVFAWVSIFNDPVFVWNDLVVIPSKMDRFGRLFKIGEYAVEHGLLTGAFILAGIRYFSLPHDQKKNYALVMLLCFAAFFSALLSAAGAQENNLVYIGLIWILLSAGSPRFLSLAIGLLLFIYGVSYSLTRSNWSFDFSLHRPMRDLQHERLGPIRFQEPGASHLESLLRWADVHVEKNDSVFVFPNSTFLYLVLDKIPPQPFVYFDIRTSFVQKNRDALLLSALQKNKPRWFIVDKGSHDASMTAEAILDECPQTRDYLKTQYQLSQEMDGYSAYKYGYPKKQSP